MQTFGVLKRTVMAGPITFTYWKGEVVELLVELRAMNLAGIREEWSDCVALLILFLSDQAGFRWMEHLPVLPGLGLYAARKFAGRLKTWYRIFDHHKVAFENHYLIEGGNYAKMWKVQVALRRAGCVAVDETWLRSEGIIKEN